MRNFLLALGMLLLPSLAFGQGSVYRTKLLDSPSGAPQANALITVCAATASLINLPCTPVTTIYTSSTDSVQKANPFRADAQGNVEFYGPTGTSYVVSVTGVISPGYSLKTEPLGGDSSSSGTGAPFTGPNPWFDVTNAAYAGSTPIDDCTHDATAAINLAITAWAANPAGTLYFPPPTTCYLVNGTINWPLTFTSWHTVLMNGPITMGATGQAFKLDRQGSGSVQAIHFIAQSGGATGPFAYGPYVVVATNSNSRTLPIMDMRGAANVTFDGFYFYQNSSMGTEAILAGESETTRNGMIDVQFSNGGAACLIGSCVPFRQDMAFSVDVEFGLKFNQFTFIAAGSGGSYSAVFQNQGGIQLENCFWNNYGVLFQNIGASGMRGFSISGVISLSEDLNNDLLNFDTSGGDIDDFYIDSFGGTSDNNASIYLVNVVGSGNLNGLYINATETSTIWDLVTGKCPSGTILIGTTTQSGMFTTACPIQAMSQDALRLSSGTTNIDRAALVIPHGKIAVAAGSNSQCGSDCSATGPDLIMVARAGASGIGSSTYRFTQSQILLDSASDSGISMSSGNASTSGVSSTSPSGDRELLFFSHDGTGIGLYSDSNGGGFSYITGNSIKSAGSVQFTNNGNIGLFTGASLGAARTYTMVNASLAACCTNDPGGNGLVARTALGTATNRSIAITAPIEVTNGDGVSGNPTLACSTCASSSSTNTFTNKTFDTAGTGNVLKYNGVTVTVFTGSATLDFGSLVSIGCEDLTMTVTGASSGDPVYIGVPNGSVPSATFTFSGWVSSANTVTVRGCALVSGDPASGTFKATVTHF